MSEIYEPITDEQIKKIHATVREQRSSYENLYAMIADIILIPSIGALSRQEACFIIERLLGEDTWQRPPRCRGENEIPGGGANLPTMKQIWGIRKMVQKIGWNREHFNAWLKKYRHITSIRKHNRKQAGDTYSALKNILSRALKNISSEEEENRHVIH